MRGAGISRDAIDEVLADMDDRIRLPLPCSGGAWHVGVAGSVPWLLLPSLLLLGAASARGLVAAAIAMLPSIYWWHSRALRLRRRSKLLMSWMLASLTYESLLYALVLAPSQTHIETAMFTAPLCVTLLLFAAMKRVDPSRTDGLAEAGCAVARSVHCAVCGITIPRYDHYCAWIDEPIGSANHRAYVGFVACMLATCVVGAWQLGSREMGAWRQVYANNASSFLLAGALYGIAIAIAVGALLAHQISLISAGTTAYEARRRRRRDAKEEPSARRNAEHGATYTGQNWRAFGRQTATLADTLRRAAIGRQALQGSGSGKAGGGATD